MRDRDVRASLRHLLADTYSADPDTRFIEELGLCGQVRVDVAVVNGHLAGFELKSERDTLRRLPMQIDVYSRVLNSATLVVAERHAVHALDLLPEWWGVMVATSTSAGVCLVEDRTPRPNPEVQATALVSLLWRDEALEALATRGLAEGVRSKPKRELWGRLVEEIPLGELQAIVCDRIKNREGWRPDR